MSIPNQLRMSPYYGETDFSKLCSMTTGVALDKVSLADIYRNAFVYPPYSIVRDLRLATFGFDPAADLNKQAEFNPPMPDIGSSQEQDWLENYHHLLCNAVHRGCEDLRSPWMLQSGGKDSTSIAIAVADVRPDMICLTYLGGREENEIESARAIAKRLGLRHERLVCNPIRAYDRYLALVGRMPLLTADFALLSYADLATEVADAGGDGILDGLGSDIYFGTPVNRQQQLLQFLSRRMRLPNALLTAPLVRDSFKLCFALGTLQMDKFERFFPGSRFTDTEVDELLGAPVSAMSRRRLETFRQMIDKMPSSHDQRTLSVIIAEAAAAFSKGLLTAHALGLRAVYPYCDKALREWVTQEVPSALRMNLTTGTSKILVRQHINRHFDQLPYVNEKGSFRFDLCGLASARFDQVFAIAEAVQGLVPGAIKWLERHRHRMNNKYHASKFYLLAVTLPWLRTHVRSESGAIFGE